jgi:release factor glutamine methyltransferase
MPQWTIEKLLNWTTDHFTEKGLDSPRLSAELLIAHVMDLERIQVYMNFDKSPSQPQLDQLHQLVKRAVDSEPIAYLIGKTEFYSLPIKVTPDCLIPRPETELLVERAIDLLRTRTGLQSILDLSSP